MTRAATQAERFDHAHDNRKHDPRPGDQLTSQQRADELLREHQANRQTDLAHLAVDARTVAILARASTTSLDEAMLLIQNFANVTSSAAVVEAIEKAHRRVMEIMSA